MQIYIYIYIYAYEYIKIYMSRYAKLRLWSPEVYYNLGRALHQLSLLSLAAPCYEHVLVADAVCAPDTGQAPAAMSLKREAAYNLSLIYRQSGAGHLARHVLAAYCAF